MVTKLCKKIIDALNTFLIKHQNVPKCFFVLLGMAFVAHGYADGGTDLMAGTQGDATATFFGSGKFYLYLAEIVAAIIGYITTHSMKVFIGIIIVAFVITSIAPHFLNSSSI